MFLLDDSSNHPLLKLTATTYICMTAINSFRGERGPVNRITVRNLHKYWAEIKLVTLLYTYFLAFLGHQ